MGDRAFTMRQVCQEFLPSREPLGGCGLNRPELPVVRSAEPFGGAGFPQGKTLVVAQEVAEAILEAVAVRVLPAQVFVAAVISCNRGVARKGSDLFLLCAV